MQEAKPYKSDNDVLAMTNLVDAYQRNNITEFEKVLKTNRYATAELLFTGSRLFLLPAALNLLILGLKPFPVPRTLALQADYYGRSLHQPLH